MLALTALAASVVACDGEGATGPAGPAGVPGDPGDQGNPGDKGDPGDAAPGEPSINGITPHIAYLERSVEVTISGFGTEFTNPTVDFGAGITVDDVTVASGTGIVATVTIADDATLGTRDVTVSESGTDFTYADAFTVRAPLAFTDFAGVAEQGGILLGRVDMLDKSTPFDTSSEGALTDLFHTAGVAGVSNLTPFSMDTVMFLDVTATGDSDIIVDSVVDSFLVTSRQPAAFSVAARTPQGLTIGTTENGTMPAAEFGTVLYEVSVAADSIAAITFATTTVDPAAQNGGFSILSSTGTWAESPAGGNIFGFDSGGGTFEAISDDTASTFYLVAVNFGDEAFPFTIDVVERASNDIESNDTCNDAQDLDVSGGFPAGIDELGLQSAADEDWFTVTVDDTVIGQAFLAETLPGDVNTDTVVEVFSGACGTLTSMGVSTDLAIHDSVISSAIPAAGTYFIKVSHSTFVGSGQIYNLSVDVVDVPPPPTEEVEPNNDTTDALANNHITSLTEFGDSVELHGALPGANYPDDGGDIDFWAIDIPTSVSFDAYIYAETYGTAWYSCSLFDENSVDTVLTMYDADGDFVATNDDVSFPSNACSVLDLTNGGSGFPAGTYYFEVDAYTPADYNLHVDVY